MINVSGENTMNSGDEVLRRRFQPATLLVIFYRYMLIFLLLVYVRH